VYDVYVYVQINPIEIWQTKFPDKVLTTMSNNLIHNPPPHLLSVMMLFHSLSTACLSISLSRHQFYSPICGPNFWQSPSSYTLQPSCLRAGCEVSHLMIVRPRAGVQADTYKTLKTCALRTHIVHTHTHIHPYNDNHSGGVYIVSLGPL